jgi:hypothetical protein
VIFAFRKNAAFSRESRIKGPSLMDIDLNFTCCECGRPVALTVNCQGDAAAATTTVASVRIPCPSCGTIIRVAFAPDGTLHHVVAQAQLLRWAEPSLN